jgi:hypothetical protein
MAYSKQLGHLAIATNDGNVFIRKVDLGGLKSDENVSLNEEVCTLFK